MAFTTRTLTGLAGALALALAAVDADAQGFGDRLKKKAQERIERAKEAAAEKTVDKAENTVKCAVSDSACAEKARAEGKTVETVADGAATGTTAAPAAAGRTLKPGEGAWANYDFVPGTRPVFVEDFSRDVVGDFPRRMEFESGALEIVEWNGGRYLRANSTSKFYLTLPEVLPERFTLEFDFAAAANQEVWISFGDNENARVEVSGDGSVGLYHGNIQANGRYDAEYNKGNVFRRLRLLVDGKYAKVYYNDKRILNVPNANFPRSGRIRFHTDAREGEPAMFGNFAVMAGGRRLYDDLAASGRVATQGIFFDTGSDVIRPESSPTLKEIAAMLNEHADLSLLIEGHTDNVGAAASNLALSEKRAAAVKAALVSGYGVDGGRLTTKGLGDTKPAGPNATAEGRQQNRRVELVKR